MLRIFSSLVGAYDEEDEVTRDVRSGWLRAGRDLGRCACVCRGWRDALRFEGVRQPRAPHANLWWQLCEMQGGSGSTKVRTSKSWHQELRRRVNWCNLVLRAIKDEISKWMARLERSRLFLLPLPPLPPTTRLRRRLTLSLFRFTPLFLLRARQYGRTSGTK